MDNVIQKLYLQFDNSVNWNAFLYITQKLLTTILTIFLFYKLTPADFSLWANINSVIFLILLWCDFGFRKSLPQYFLKFGKNKLTHALFTKYVIKFQLLLLTLIFSILLLIQLLFIPIKTNSLIIFFAFIIFLLESSIALLKLIYHSHFWNKHFNVIYCSVIFIETSAILFFLYLEQSSYRILVFIFLVKGISGIIINFLGIYYLINLYKNYEYINSTIEDFKILKKEFLQHSIIMWGSSIIKSLTERNFIFPFLTYYSGVEIANLFKVANDWALLFQRSILKTIGTTDTSLLSGITELGNEETLTQNAFEKISSKLIALCLPFFGIIMFLFFNKHYFVDNNKLIFQTFIILVICYLIESLLSVYERVLEIKKHYSVIYVSYLPIILFICMLFIFPTINLLGIVKFLILLCSVRLVSILIITFYVKKFYKLKNGYFKILEPYKSSRSFDISSSKGNL